MSAAARWEPPKLQPGEVHLPAVPVTANLLPILVLLVAGVACRDRASEPAFEERNRESLRDRARTVLERECGECHIPGSPTPLKAALAVYDLREEEWASRMTDAQLRKLSSRIVGGAAEMFDPFDVRNSDAGPPPPPGSRDIETVQSYVQVELAHRIRVGLGEVP